MKRTQLDSSAKVANKVPEVTLGFWIIKLMSTTVGETCADYLAVNAGWGLGITTTVMLALLATALTLQLRAHSYVPWTYWTTVLLVSVVGTQVTDAMTDILGISLYTSTATFAIGLLTTLWTWYLFDESLSFQAIFTRRRELFYWAAILCTFALGTAAGDLATEALGLGFKYGVLVFGVLAGCTYTAWRMGANAVLTFWIAYVLTRPLGAALGDLLTQSQQYGGIGLGASMTSAMFLAVIAILVVVAHFRDRMPADRFDQNHF